MQLRRPIAALFTALALFGGGTATLAGCGDPAGLDRRDGTSDDNARDPQGANPSDASQGNLPNVSDPDRGNPGDQNNRNQPPN